MATKTVSFVLNRVSETKNSTAGQFIDVERDRILSVILEDGYREVKVKGETRIPSGIVEIDLVESGSHHEKYLKYYNAKAGFGEGWHKGMILLKNVKDFTGILIHWGLTSKDTAGCLLTGLTTYLDKGVNEYKITQGTSRLGYEKLYPVVRDEILKNKKEGKKTYLKIIDPCKD